MLTAMVFRAFGLLTFHTLYSPDALRSVVSLIVQVYNLLFQVLTDSRLIMAEQLVPSSETTTSSQESSCTVATITTRLVIETCHGTTVEEGRKKKQKGNA